MTISKMSPPATPPAMAPIFTEGSEDEFEPPGVAEIGVKPIGLELWLVELLREF